MLLIGAKDNEVNGGCGPYEGKTNAYRFLVRKREIKKQS
jgi:hypothetical protein